MNLHKAVEYAVYHDNLEKKNSLPGIKNGLPIKAFFLRNTNYNIYDFENLTSTIIHKTIDKIDNINLLCSGGVDSSILVCLLNKKNKKFIGINNFYPNYRLNDLEKINSLRKFQKFKIKKVKISPKNYIFGMNLSFQKNYFGNTYAPTLYYSVNQFKKSKNKILMTGSGPDELFYGMEKYDMNFLKKLSNLKTDIALEKIDTNYNYEFYKNILNSKGIEILSDVINKRRLLYKKIAQINKNILEAQRILAYCTITNQHFEMFEKVSKNFNLKHKSPFLDEEYIKFAFSFKKSSFDANMGKSQLKKMLAKHTSIKHAYDKKIGFHAPISKMINEKEIIKNLDKAFNYDKLEEIIDIDKLIINLNLNKKEKLKNYNIYSLIGLQKMLN